MRASLCLLVACALVAQTALASTNSGDANAIKGLTKCVQANLKNLNGVLGWYSTESASPAATAANNALLAAGTPGVNINDPCGTPSFSGLICSGDRITQVQLNQLGPNGLKGCDIGTLSDLSGLDQATQVAFEGTGLTGTLPGAWSSGFGSLKLLSLFQNSISGPLPSGWSSGFKSLQNLQLQQNSIEGSVPASWGNDTNFPQLLTLELGQNKLSGSMPLWTGFPKIQLLGFAHNNLSGVLPGPWKFDTLSQLQLENNNFTGCLPNSWGPNFPDLTHLSVENNNLFGTIPASYATDKLTDISITPGNDFSGTISSDLATSPDPNNPSDRFQPAPAQKNGSGGYDLGSGNGQSCPAYTDPNANSTSSTSSASSAGRKLLQS